MQVILLEKHRKLGDVGSIVNVKNGFARNFLVPNKKAIQATKENKEIFKQREKIIHKELEQKKADAKKISSSIESKWIYILKQAGKDGKLYGSVTSVDIIKAIGEQLKQELQKSNIHLLTPIKYIGRHNISVNVFADIYVDVNVIVSRTKEEAEIDLKNAIEGKTTELEVGKVELNKQEKDTKHTEQQTTQLEQEKSSPETAEKEQDVQIDKKTK
ncbi:MAG: 50S ribosomal protein L9 [Rickettsiales bacterium]|nr:50S ribosomal protein L9 [Rickettsiales bacterium]